MRGTSTACPVCVRRRDIESLGASGNAVARRTRDRVRVLRLRASFADVGRLDPRSIVLIVFGELHNSGG
jgi:hypothetical protein